MIPIRTRTPVGQSGAAIPKSRRHRRVGRESKSGQIIKSGQTAMIGQRGQSVAAGRGLRSAPKTSSALAKGVATGSRGNLGREWRPGDRGGNPNGRGSRPRC